MALSPLIRQEPEPGLEGPIREFKFRGACDCGWTGAWWINGAEQDLKARVMTQNGAEGMAWNEIKIHVAESHGDQFHGAPVRCESEAIA